MKLLFSLFFIVFLNALGFSQLSNFVLNVTATNETCTANGSLFFTVTGATTGSTIAYSIYKLPNTTTPITITNANSYGGLIAGTYRVIATQSLGNTSGTKQQDVVITNQIVPLTYQLVGQNEVCGFDGTITVTTATGTAVGYEIISGPILKPLQTSNVFTGLTAGLYQIRVFDVCGEGVVQAYTLFKIDTQIKLELTPISLVGCNFIEIGVLFNHLLLQGVVQYPLTVATTINQPLGNPVLHTTTIVTSSTQESHLELIPYYPNQTYSYSFQITDACGDIYNISGTVSPLEVGPSYMLTPIDCTHKNLTLQSVQSAVLTSAPSSYTNALPFNYTNQIVNNEVTIYNLLPGTYVFQVIDVCANPSTITITITSTQNIEPSNVVFNTTCISGNVSILNVSEVILTAAPITYPNSLPYNYTSQINSEFILTILNLPLGVYTFSIKDTCGNAQTMVVVISPPTNNVTTSVLEGCTVDYGSVKITGQLATAYITSAPANYPHLLPYNITQNIQNGTAIYLSNLPAGTYQITTTNLCNVIKTTTFVIQGYYETTNIELFPHCGSFDLKLTHISNNYPPPIPYYWLQKYNPVTSTWGDPLTNSAYIDGTFPTTTNSDSLLNNQINYNFGYTGLFRIIKPMLYYDQTANNQLYCYSIIKEFEFLGLPKINNVYSISCTNSYEVVVDAFGAPPLLYRITKKNGIPFIIQNGNSNIFTALAPATYNFQVEDACGNILNSEFTVAAPNPMTITASQFCNGQPASLTVPVFSFLQYRWYKSGNPATTLSTTNSLNFNPFSLASNSGLYYVQITYTGNPNSCLNQTIGYTIPNVQSTPHAGLDRAISYCGNQGIINLNLLLQGTFDANGVWAETTTSGMLNAANWNTTLLASGTYIFKYTVAGLCSNTSDEAIITITLKPVPSAPIITGDTLLCIGQTLHLNSNLVAGATYSWTGPNGFLSSLQNPTIANVTVSQSGSYSLVQTLNGCSSITATLQVQIDAVAFAGVGNNQSLCGNNGTINLFSLLSGNYTTNGVWSETTSSGMLSGSLWNSTSVLPGTYSFKYSVISLCGSTDTEIVSITITQIPATPLATGDTLLCENQTLHLFASTVAGASYLWSGPNGFSSTTQNPILNNATILNAGNYTVKTINNGCASTVATIAVAIYKNASAGIGSSKSYCGSNGSINLFTLLSGNYDTFGTWTETTNSGLLSGSFWNAALATPATYTFVYSVTSLCGNVDNETVSITINAIPSGVLATTDAILCENQNLNLYASSIIGVSYSWSGPNGFSSTLQNPIIANATTSNNGLYTVYVTKNGCSSPLATVMVLLGNVPQFSFDNYCDQNKMMVKVVPIANSFMPNDVTYQWFGSNGFISTANFLELTSSQAGTYTLIVTNSLGCSSSKEINFPSIGCGIQNGISPNGDGLNDSFDLTGMNIKEFKIFNRYGIEVYEKQGYVNEWSGQSKNGNILPSGTYYYYFIKNDGQAKTGWIYLAIEN